MSAPQKTSGQSIRAAARAILEEQGIESVSMQAVATAVGVKPPSLYKHFTDRADLLKAVKEEALAELQRAIDKAVRPGSAYQNLERMAAAYRMFAKKNPCAYQLVFAAEAPRDEADLRARAAAAATLLKLLTDVLGPEKALPSARTLVAFLHGFVLMESSGLFRLGGDINQVFNFGITTILHALLYGTAPHREV